MEFFIYDIGFMIIFSAFVAYFLYSRRKNLKREGIMFLYRTKLGIKAINYIGDKFSKFLHSIKYLVIGTGFVLMAGMIYLLGYTIYTYIKFPQITKFVKAPPVMPLIPYFPKLFGMQSFFPNFYFTYFILALIVVAVSHEFSHGIFMRLFKIKIKSTGFVFLGPILGAFVEQDEKQMKKKKSSEQMVVLGAGTFANLILALLFFCLLILYFNLSFVPSGYIFNNYAYSIIPTNLISKVGNLSDNLTEIYVGEKKYFLDHNLKKQLGQNISHIVVYDDAPAIRAGLKGAIEEIDGIKISNREDLKKFLLNKKPGDEIKIKTINDGKEKIYTLRLGKHPANKSMAYLGIVSSVPTQNKGIIRKIVSHFMYFRNSSTYYKPRFNKDLAYFIYNLFYWIALINLFVALFNMLPLAILDGGRFFYLAVFSLTKSKKIATNSFKFISYVIILIFILMLFSWLSAL